MTIYAVPGQPGSPATVQARYDNWIGGEFVAPVEGKYFENASPVTGQVYCEVRAARKVVLAGHGPVSGCWRRPRMVSRSGGSLRIFRRVAAIRV